MAVLNLEKVERALMKINVLLYCMLYVLYACVFPI